MYESFYGLTEKPFTLLPDPEYLYLSPKHQRALTLLEYGMMNQAGFSVICGDTGAGKTTLIRRLLSELGDDTTVGLITNTHKSFGDLLNWVLMAFGIDSENKSKSQMHHMFIAFLVDQYARNMRTVLIVDEAQNMNAETLEELRMLSNINADKDQVLQVILAGQPALRDTLRKPELMQFAQRISVDYYLESLNQDETAHYINYRLSVAGAANKIFTDAACDAVYRYSGGTPRLINLLCDTALVYGYAEQTNVIEVCLVDDVVREQHSNSIVPTFNKPLMDEVKRVAVPPIKQVVEQTIEEKEKPDVDDVSNDELEQRIVQATLNSDVAAVDNAGSINEAANKPITVEKNSEPDVQKKINESVKAAKISSIKQDVDNTVSPVEKITIDEVSKAADSKEQASINKAALEDEIVFEEVAHKDRREYKEKIVNRNEFMDSYPVIHVDDSAKNSAKVLVLGFIGGIILASALTIGGVYFLFGEKLSTNVVRDNTEIVSHVANTSELELAEIERRKLEAMEKERDAALAITKALERERDAALTAAKAQENMREVEKRVSEIMAEQERKTAVELNRANIRVRKAEQDAINAKEREQAAKLKALQMKLEAEEKIRVAEREASAQQILEPVVSYIGSNPPVVKVEPESAAMVTVDLPAEVTKKENKSREFSANPCSSPSAKFLSTCKK